MLFPTETNLILAGAIIVTAWLGFFLMMRAKRAIEPLAQNRQPRIVIVRDDPGLPCGRRLLGGPAGDAQNVVEGEFREI